MSKKVVFVSHIEDEKEVALQVKAFIEEAFLGLIDVFISSDENSILLGEKWLDNITEALKRCCIEIVICSPISIKRPWINFEAGAGWIREIPVIPLCHSGIQPSKLPIPLNLLQGANVNQISELRLLLTVLANVIGSGIPKYDFVPFVDQIKTFEKKYTFWNECNNCFVVLEKYTGPLFYDILAGKPSTILVSDIEKEELNAITSFLKENEILDCRPTGNRISNEGNETKYTISPLSRLISVVNNIEFSK